MTVVPGMSRRDLVKYLSLPLIAKLATVNRDGSPQISPVWFSYRDRAIYIATYEDAVKIKNIRRDSRVSVIIDSTDGGLKLRGVLFRGRAELIRGRPAKQIERAIYDKYLPRSIVAKDRVAAAFKRASTVEFAGSVSIKVNPERISTWDYAKMTLKDAESSEFQAYESARAGDLLGGRRGKA